MHTPSYWKGFTNAFILLFGIGLLVLTYLTWDANLLKVFAGHVQVTWMIEPFRWLAVSTFGIGGLVMIYFFLGDSYDFDLRFHRKTSTIDL